MSFAYIGKDFYLVASPKKRFFIKVGAEKVKWYSQSWR